MEQINTNRTIFHNIFILFIIIIVFTGCDKNKKKDEEFKVDNSIKLATGIVEEEMKSSNHKVIKTVGKIGIGSAIINAYEVVRQKREQQEQELLLENAKRIAYKMIHDAEINGILKNKIQIDLDEILVRKQNKKGYLQHMQNDNTSIFLFFGYENLSTKEEYILSEKDFFKLSINLIKFYNNIMRKKYSLNINDIETFEDNSQLTKINDDISLLYSIEREKYAIIIKNKYYSWFDIYKCYILNNIKNFHNTKGPFTP